MSNSRKYIALDVGDKRIGVAEGDESVKIAVPIETIERDGDEIKRIAELVLRSNATHVVIGYPRNQSGEATAQTAIVEEFTTQLTDMPAELVFQDESLTSVLAEEQLRRRGKPYSRGDIDMIAASLILQDYMEARR